MQNPDVERMIKELNQFQLPSSLMECFDTWREEAAAAASRDFSLSQLSWFLDLLNRFRRPEDRKDLLLDVFDPEMYTGSHPVWEAPPGTMIELPALTCEVVPMAAGGPGFADVAREEIRNFSEIAQSFADEEMVGLGNIANAALADQGKLLRGREDAIRYTALNASTLLENLWPKTTRSGRRRPDDGFSSTTWWPNGRRNSWQHPLDLRSKSPILPAIRMTRFASLPLMSGSSS